MAIKHMNTIKQKMYKGFTLVEMMVSVFIFLLMMVAIVQIFAQQINAYRHAKEIQSDMENAQFAMNYIAKTLRTASVLGHGSDDFTDVVQFEDNDFHAEKVEGESLVLYDFSQEECIKLTFKTEGDYTALWVIKNEGQDNFVAFDQVEDCLDPGNYAQAHERRLTTGKVEGMFYVAPTRYKNLQGSRQTDTIGRVTTAMKVWSRDDDDTEPIHLQTTVSLRDYPPDLSF